MEFYTCTCVHLASCIHYNHTRARRSGYTRLVQAPCEKACYERLVQAPCEKVWLHKVGPGPVREGLATQGWSTPRARRSGYTRLVQAPCEKACYDRLVYHVDEPIYSPIYQAAKRWTKGTRMLGFWIVLRDNLGESGMVGRYAIMQVKYLYMWLYYTFTSSVVQGQSQRGISDSSTVPKAADLKLTLEIAWKFEQYVHVACMYLFHSICTSTYICIYIALASLA